MKRAQVHLPSEVLREIELEASRHHPNETGGVLLGYSDRTDQSRLQVTLQIGPGPSAVHKRHRFEPDGEWQARQIAAAYGESGRISTYLGDWHSHPGGSTKPSRLDGSTARRISLSDPARAPRPLILIVAGHPPSWEFALYRRTRWRLQPAEIVLQPSEQQFADARPRHERD